MQLLTLDENKPGLDKCQTNEVYKLEVADGFTNRR